MVRKKKDVEIKMFVKDGCGACAKAKELVGGLLEDLSEYIDIEIIQTNPKIVAENNLIFAPTMRFGNGTELIGGQITPEIILAQIRKMRFEK